MIRIGIVGAENTHSAAIAKTLNVEGKVPGCRVVAIWGETDEFASRTAQAGHIPTIVRRPADLIGLADAVVIDHRHAKHHLPAAEALLSAGLPMFIDKPFCYRLAQGRGFLERARKAGVPVTSFSTVPLQKTFGDFRRAVAKAGAVRAAASFGPCDLKSPYGGVFFYGIHQVDMIVEAFGTDLEAVCVRKAGKGRNAVAALLFASGLTASMHCLAEGSTGFQISAATDGGAVSARIVSDANPYLTGIRTFCAMFKTGKEPAAHRRILTPVAVLEALERSVRTGKVEKVAKV
jgi:predicted dehydrogenase